MWLAVLPMAWEDPTALTGPTKLRKIYAHTELSQAKMVQFQVTWPENKTCSVHIFKNKQKNSK